MTVSTSQLTEDAYKVCTRARLTTALHTPNHQVDQFAGEVKLLIEVQEDGIMGPHVVKEGATLPVRRVQVASSTAQSAQVGAVMGMLCSSHQVALHASTLQTEGLRQVTWQSYLASPEE